MGSPEHPEDTTSTDISYGESKSPASHVPTREEAVQQLAPLKSHVSHTSFSPEVTIRSVAPLVLVLTGATFLNVSEMAALSAGSG